MPSASFQFALPTTLKLLRLAPSKSVTQPVAGVWARRPTVESASAARNRRNVSFISNSRITPPIGGLYGWKDSTVLPQHIPNLVMPHPGCPGDRCRPRFGVGFDRVGTAFQQKRDELDSSPSAGPSKRGAQE